MDSERAWEYLAQQPIRVPGSPFWNVLTRFGRDEAYALTINVAVTALFSLINPALWLLAIIGPIAEKIGFFPGHIKDALHEYNTTHKKLRKTRSHYIKRAFKNGSKSLAEDLAFHDPLYIGFMALGFWLFAATPPWILSLVSFVIAILLVAIGEVAYTELQYKRFGHKLKKTGFQKERYYETRFLISATTPPEAVIKEMQQAFKLENPRTLHYTDVYYANTLPLFSGRTASLRLRKRTAPPGKKRFFQTAQIVYTRARETTLSPFEQNRFFPVLKEKYYFIVEGTMPKTLNHIKQEHLKKHLQTFVATQTPHQISFTRHVIHDKELLVSADEVQVKQDAYIVELKVHGDLKLLMQAMRYIMKTFPVLQTTHMKSELLQPL